MSAEWAPALERVAVAQLTLVIGDTDTGKTTLVTWLANALSAGGESVGIVDADLGQSEIGPPTAIGAGRVARPVARLAEAEVVALHFVGSTSPLGHFSATVQGTRTMVDRARSAGVRRVLVDTCGLVAGDWGRALKQAKIRLLDPDLIVCLQRDEECEHILRACDAERGPGVLRLAVSRAGRRRTPEERRRHRERALGAYFAAARPVTLDRSRVALRGPSPVAGAGPADATSLSADFQGVLVGLEDAAGETIGLGVIQGVDGDASGLTIDTPVVARDIAAVVVGHERYARSPAVAPYIP